jgi:hypothetical protein
VVAGRERWKLKDNAMESRVSTGNHKRRRVEMRRLTAATAVIAIVALAGSAGAFTLAEWERYGWEVLGSLPSTERRGWL